MHGPEAGRGIHWLGWLRHPSTEPNVEPSSAGRDPPPGAIAILDAMARVQLAQDSLQQAESDLAAALRSWGSGPISFTILVDGKVPTGMPQPVNDVTFFVHVLDAKDAAGRIVPDPGPFTYTVVTDTSTVDNQIQSTSATTAEDPNHAGDTSFAQVNVVPADASGIQPNFRVVVSDGTHFGITDVLVPTPGGPSSLDIGVSSD